MSKPVLQGRWRPTAHPSVWEAANGVRIHTGAGGDCPIVCLLPLCALNTIAVRSFAWELALMGGNRKRAIMLYAETFHGAAVSQDK